MSLLHQDASEEIDDAARGEELTKGTSHIVWASVAAAVVITIGIAAVVIANEKPPIAVGEVTQIRVHPRHIESSGKDANGAAMAKLSFDQILVFAHVRLANQSKDPLSLHEILTNATLADGIHSSAAAPVKDYDRLFIAYPDLINYRGKPLSSDMVIQPGQTVEGEIVSAFQLSKQQWDAHKELNFSFAFRYQPRLVLKPTTPEAEQ